jgi:hypothetical protein
MKNKKNPATHNFHLSIIIGKGSLAKFGYKEKYEIEKKKFKHLSQFWLHARTQYRKIWQFSKIFLVLKNNLATRKTHIFSQFEKEILTTKKKKPL